MSDCLEAEELKYQEHDVWRQHASGLYDLIYTQVLEWPSLTCQWLPERFKSTTEQFNSHSLLLGSCTPPGYPNYLMIAQAELPFTPHELVDAIDEGASISHDTLPLVQPQKRFDVDTAILQARCMPQNPNLVAVAFDSKTPCVFDITKPSAEACMLRLCGHQQEANMLDFNPLKEGCLITCARDNSPLLWDFEESTSGAMTDCSPAQKFQGHTECVTAVAWNPSEEVIFGSVSDDKTFKVWDVRSNGNRPVSSVQAHNAEVTCLAFNNFSGNIAVTGAMDNTICLWDTRSMKKKLHTFRAHEAEVLCLQWSPNHEMVFASGCANGKVCIWDLVKVGLKQDAEDQDVAPAELVFVHAGHMARISDLSWSPSREDPWLLASVAEDNALHIWRAADHIVNVDLPE